MQFIMALYCMFLAAGAAENDRALRLFEQFDSDAAALPPAAWSYDYREYFRNIPSQQELQQRRNVFERYRQSLDSIQRSTLTDPVRTDYDHLRYIVDFELRRIDLEQRYVAMERPAVGDTGLAGLADAREWYGLFVQRFTTLTISPDDLYEFGLREVAQSQQELSSIRKQLGFSTDSAAFYNRLQHDSFVLTDADEVIRGYENIQKTVYANLPRLFNSETVQPPAISAIPSAGPQSPPAYYDPSGQGTFYFNFYGNRHNRRSMPFLYLHEAVPGHHYHFSREQTIGDRPAFAGNAMYPGYFEGWAAYTELLGDSLGVYDDPYDRLGRWEWDLVRSVRICLDVGIHAKGWTKAQALEFWYKNIPHLNDIADREVTRCTLWPGQVLSYKAGEAEIERLRDRMREKEGPPFDLRRFHAFVLERGQLPLAVLASRMDEILHGSSRTNSDH